MCPPLWLCGNSWPWAHDIRLSIVAAKKSKSVQAKSGA